MNDKQQLAAMGAQYRLTEEQAKALAERMPKTGALQILDDDPLCMAKRIEELEVQVRVMAGLLRESTEWMDDHPAMPDSRRMHEALSGRLPSATVPEGFLLVPDGWLPDGDGQIPSSMSAEGAIRIKALSDLDLTYYELDEIFRAMLAAAPSPDGTK